MTMRFRGPRLRPRRDERLPRANQVEAEFYLFANVGVPQAALLNPSVFYCFMNVGAGTLHTSRPIRFRGTGAVFRPKGGAVFRSTLFSAIPTPHIWYVFPSRVHPGDTVSVVGTGFGASQGALNGQLTFGVGPAPVITAWFSVPAGATAYTPGRLISSTTDDAAPEHQRIQFKVSQDAQSGNINVITN